MKTAASDRYVATSSPDFYPANAEAVDSTFTLPEIVVPANEWFNFRFVFLVQARVLTSRGYSVSSSDGDFKGTLRFVGLSLTDMNGLPVDFTIDSASGAHDTEAGIAAPAPEPATAGLWAVALVAQAVRAWGRRRKSAA